MNTLLSLKCLRFLPLIAVALLLAHSRAFADPSHNTSYGIGALQGNAGAFNTGIGYFALHKNDDVLGNTAVGADAMGDNTTGERNTANGWQALTENTIGNKNVAVGARAAFSVKTGSQNTVVGSEALDSGNVNTDTGSNNIAVGYQAGRNLVSGSNNNIEIGNQGVTGDSSTIRIGDSNQTRTFIAGISGVAVSGAGVLVNASGQLGVAASSARFKDDIKPMDKASETILGLNPVSFHYKEDIDPAGTSQFGLVAEEVEKVNPDLVVRDKEGKPYTVRYDAVNAMLLNEFLKEHRKVEQQGRTIKEQEATIAQLKQDFQSRLAQEEKEIEALTAGLQKVSAQVEMSKSAPQMAENHR
jgi:hypothetical protein